MFKPLPNIKPVEQTIGPSRRLALNPITLATCILLALFFFLFFSANRYPAQIPIVQFSLAYAWAFIFFGGFYFFSGGPLHYLVLRNIPFAAAFFLLFTLLSALEASFAYLFFQNYQGFGFFIWHIFSTQMSFVPAIIISVIWILKF